MTSGASALEYSDLLEHFNAILALLLVMTSLAAWLFWRLYTKTERKVDQLCKDFAAFKDGFLHHKAECEKIHGRFMKRSEIDKEIDDIWSALNNHGHSPDGKVSR